MTVTVTESPFPKGAPTVDIPLESWEPIGDCMTEEGDPKSRLLCSIYIFGTLHHIDAIEVKRDAMLGWIAANDDFDEHLDRIVNGFDPGEQYEAAEIDGRTYLVFMEPSC